MRKRWALGSASEGQVSTTYPAALPAGSSAIQVARAVFESPVFWPSLLLLAGLTFSFWTLISYLPTLYFDSEGYYSHGLLMPFAAGYAIYRNWDRIKDRAVCGSNWALVPLGLVLLLLRPASLANLDSMMSLLLVASILCGVWYVAGFSWLKAVSLPILLTLWGLPIWSMAINSYTNPLQSLSTKVAFAMLKLIGMAPLSDGTVIHLNHFDLDIGVPCSGLKLLVALCAFSSFFMLIARLRWISNVVLAVLVLPMALLFNGLRIAMIGFVGETWGSAAGRQFHDFSGYLMLGICFMTFFKLVRWLGWKD